MPSNYTKNIGVGLYILIGIRICNSYLGFPQKSHLTLKRQMKVETTRKPPSPFPPKFNLTTCGEEKEQQTNKNTHTYSYLYRQI
jgi:hypothetical protein